MDALLYKPAHEVSYNKLKKPQKLDESGNEADTEYEPPEENDGGDYKINPRLDFNLNFDNNVADVVEDDGIINENIKLVYEYAVATKSEPSCTSIEVDDLFEFEFLAAYHLPLRSFLLSQSKITKE